MPETDTKKDQIQIYKEKLSEIYRQNEELVSENEKLHKDNDELQSQSQTLKGNYENVLAQNKALIIQNKEQQESSASILLLLKARGRWFLILYLVIFIMAVAMGVWYARMKQLEDKFFIEQSSRRQAEEELAVAGKAKAKAEEELIDAINAREDAEEAVTQLYGGLRKVLDENYGFSSDNLYTEEDILLLKVGQTKTIKIHNPIYYMYAESSDEEALSIEQDNPFASVPEVEISAQRPGVFTVNCAAYSVSKKEADYFEEDFNILVIVLEEDETMQNIMDPPISPEFPELELK